jgi:putative glycosyltransferase (TIGR04348 family)
MVLSMNIQIISPAESLHWSGNRVTAERWGRILRKLGHRVSIQKDYNGSRRHLLVALHARRSAEAVVRFRKDFPQAPVIVCLTGTDLYRDIRTSRRAQRVLEWADRLIVLHPLGIEGLPVALRPKTRVVYQSVKRLEKLPKKAEDTFDVCVLSNLRAVKDPLRTAMAARLLPKTSRIRVVHIGRALSRDMERRAKAENARNPRYDWLGELPRAKALRAMARCRVLVLSSKMEGGANVISEAVSASVPVLASRIPGSIGLLGKDYPGFFPYGDTRSLARLLTRIETNGKFISALRERCERVAPLFAPEAEQAAWKNILKEL